VDVQSSHASASVPDSARINPTALVIEHDGQIPSLIVDCLPAERCAVEEVIRDEAGHADGLTQKPFDLTELLARAGQMVKAAHPDFRVLLPTARAA
jgi:hypothetical protein